MKNSSNTIMNQNRDLPACSTVSSGSGVCKIYRPTFSQTNNTQPIQPTNVKCQTPINQHEVDNVTLCVTLLCKLHITNLHFPFSDTLE